MPRSEQRAAQHQQHRTRRQSKPEQNADTVANTSKPTSSQQSGTDAANSRQRASKKAADRREYRRLGDRTRNGHYKQSADVCEPDAQTREGIAQMIEKRKAMNEELEGNTAKMEGAVNGRFLDVDGMTGGGKAINVVIPRTDGYEEECGEEKGHQISADYDWDAEEEVLRKQAEAAEKQMAALQKKRNLIQFKKRERELTTKNQERIKNNVNIAEKELRLRVQALRDEKDDRLSKVERFKGELKERIDALCRCYEEVSVRALTVGNAFEEAEKKLVDEARREVERESRRLEGEKEAELIKVRKKLLGE